MTEQDKLIQDLRRVNELLIAYINHLLLELKAEEEKVTEIREQADRMIKEAER